MKVSTLVFSAPKTTCSSTNTASKTQKPAAYARLQENLPIVTRTAADCMSVISSISEITSFPKTFKHASWALKETQPRKHKLQNTELCRMEKIDTLKVSQK